MKGILKKILGFFLFLIGLAILLTPLTPGSVLILVGLDLMVGDSWPWWTRTKERLWRRFRK